MSSEQKLTSARALPSVGRLLESGPVRRALERLPRAVVADALRAELAQARARLNDGPAPTADALIAGALARADAAHRTSLRPAINATGVVLHTGLGRAVLAEEAREAVARIAAGHGTLEVDAESGRRGSRQEHARGLLCELTGAESALVLNNNAGATFLAVAALAAGREVVISRGELVEIGGSFRMPDIVRASGARLVEVGTTNRTRLADYERAITDDTGLLLRCHPSNFRIVGFTEEVPASELAALGRARGIPVMDDLGSGALVDTSAIGAGPTVTLRAAVATGCDVVTASGDKLLGGPQAGIVLGRRDAVERVARHPLARALRVDKLTLAALEATLRLYREPERAREAIPTLRYLARTREELAGMAARLARLLREAACERLMVDAVDGESRVGGGSLPGESLPTVCVRLRPSDNGPDVETLAARLRRHDPAVFGRIHEGALLLDPRALEEPELAAIRDAVRAALVTQ